MATRARCCPTAKNRGINGFPLLPPSSLVDTSPATMPRTPPLLCRRTVNLPARITSMIHGGTSPRARRLGDTAKNVGVSGRFKQGTQMFPSHARRTACCPFLCGTQIGTERAFIQLRRPVGWNLWDRLAWSWGALLRNPQCFESGRCAKGQNCTLHRLSSTEKFSTQKSAHCPADNFWKRSNILSFTRRPPLGGRWRSIRGRTMNNFHPRSCLTLSFATDPAAYFFMRQLQRDAEGT